MTAINIAITSQYYRSVEEPKKEDPKIQLRHIF